MKDKMIEDYDAEIGRLEIKINEIKKEREGTLNLKIEYEIALQFHESFCGCRSSKEKFQKCPFYSYDWEQVLTSGKNPKEKWVNLAKKYLDLILIRGKELLDYERNKNHEDENNPGTVIS